MTNWHSSVGEQNASLSNNDGVYFDFNLDGLYNGVVDPNTGPFPPASGSEYFTFNDFIDITDGDAWGSGAAANFTIWDGEIESWFATNIGAGYTASLVWDPSADSDCDNRTTFFALVSPLGTCPTVGGNYFATVADGSQTSEPCGMAFGASDGTFDLDLNGIIVVPPTTAAIPTMGEWGLMSLGLIFMILGVVSVKQRSEVFGF